MPLENVRRIIAEMKEKGLEGLEILKEESMPTPCATDEEIRAAEEACGIRFPESYKVFLKEYGGGGFLMFGAEWLTGVSGKGRELADIRKMKNSVSILYLDRERHGKDEIYVFPEKKYMPLRQLVPFVYQNAFEVSLDHWAFLCDREYPGDDYPVGFVIQGTGDVVCVLENFEKWLEVFWRGNAGAPYEGTLAGYWPVFYLLYPDWYDRMDLIDLDLFEGTHGEKIAFCDRLREKNDANFRRYGVKYERKYGSQPYGG